MNNTLKYLVFTAALIAAGALFGRVTPVESASGVSASTLTTTEESASPIYGVTIPRGYRHWELIAPSHEAGSVDELRSILGNSKATMAYQQGILPFPDGAILVKLAWKHVPSKQDNEALGHEQAFVTGGPTTVQIMVKDSRRYAATGGWGFGRFINGKPVDKAQHETCFRCHADNASANDMVFTHYAP